MNNHYKSAVRKGASNIISGFVSQFISLALGIVIPRLVLVSLGSEANGLLNSIGNILVYVALLEAGVGTASLQALYGPVASDEEDTICSILAATDRFYKRTGIIYAVVIIVLSLAFPFTIKSELPKTDIMWVVFLSGMPGVIKYFFQGKFAVFLRADGKNYILTLLAAIIHIGTSVAKIILLLLGFDVVALQLMYLIFSIIEMLFIMIYMKRRYPWMDLTVKPDYDAVSKSKNVLIHQISTLVFFNTDVLILTYFCGLKTVSVYSMYTMLFGIISTAISNFNGVDFILGQSYNTDRERYLKLQDTYEIYNMTLTFSLFCIAGLFILPFMKLYTAGVEDIEYVDKYLPYLLIATYLLSDGRSSSSKAINFAQHFKETQWRSLFESFINLTVSIVCVFKFGIYGVIFGTIAALLYRTNDMIIYANKRILKRSPWITYRRWLLNLAMFVGFTLAGRAILACVALDSYWAVIGWAAVFCVVIVPAFFGAQALAERETFAFARELLRPYLERFLKRKSTD